MPLRGSSCSSFLQAAECKRGGEGLQVASVAASGLPPACRLLLLIYIYIYNNIHVNSSNCSVPALGPWGCRTSSTTSQAAFLLRRQRHQTPEKKKKICKAKCDLLGVRMRERENERER